MFRLFILAVIFGAGLSPVIASAQGVYVGKRDSSGGNSYFVTPNGGSGSSGSGATSSSQKGSIYIPPSQGHKTPRQKAAPNTIYNNGERSGPSYSPRQLAKAAPSRQEQYRQGIQQRRQSAIDYAQDMSERQGRIAEQKVAAARAKTAAEWAAREEAWQKKKAAEAAAEKQAAVDKLKSMGARKVKTANNNGNGKQVYRGGARSGGTNNQGGRIFNVMP